MFHKRLKSSCMVDVFHQISTKFTAEHQEKNNQISPVLKWVRDDNPRTKAAIYTKLGQRTPGNLCINLIR